MPTVQEGEQTLRRPVSLVEAEYTVCDELELRFTAYAWEKLMFMRDTVAHTEIGGLAVSDTEDVMLVHDILIPKQTVTAVSTRFDQAALADTMATLADPEGEYQLPVDCFMRIWIHTHPGTSAEPSGRDIETFTGEKDFGAAPWGVMMILSDSGETHCSFRFTDVFGVQRCVQIPVAQAVYVDVPPIDEDTRLGWLKEIQDNVEELYTFRNTTVGALAKRHAPHASSSSSSSSLYLGYDDDWWGQDYGVQRFDNTAYTRQPPLPPAPTPPKTPLLAFTTFQLRRTSMFYQMDEETFLALVAQGFFHEPAHIDDVVLPAATNLAGQFERCGIEVLDENVIDEETNSAVSQFRVDPMISGLPADTVDASDVFTSDQLLDLDAAVGADPEILKELKAAEARLEDIVDDRCIEALDTEILYDGHGDPIDFVTNWVTQDGDLFYITDKELDNLHDVCAGMITAKEANFGVPLRRMGTLTDDLDIPPSDTPIVFPGTGATSQFEPVDTALCGFPHLAKVWNTVAQVVMDHIDEGGDIESLEDMLLVMREEAVAEHRELSFDRVATEIRANGYKVSSVNLEDLLGLKSAKEQAV